MSDFEDSGSEKEDIEKDEDIEKEDDVEKDDLLVKDQKNKLNKLSNKISKKLTQGYSTEIDLDEKDYDDEDDDDEDDDDDDDDDDSDFDIEKELDNELTSKNSVNTDYLESNLKTSNISPINSDIESDDEDYLQKFDSDLREEYIKKNHPECFIKNSTEVELLTKITRDKNGVIIDDNHKTIPFLTKYEKTRILGQRTKQINSGDEPYIDVPNNIIDGYLIAQLELKEKKIPIIIRRPLPNGESEYWKLSDLEQL